MQHSRPPTLDIFHAATDDRLLRGLDLLSNYERLANEPPGQDGATLLNWSAHLERRVAPVGGQCVWLRLTVDTTLVQVCQRCLLPVEVPIHVERAFRFVASEAAAGQEDDDCEEDLLVTSGTFDLAALIEDEVLLALPLVPRHAQCPVVVKTMVADAAFDAPGDKPNPFAVLAGLPRK